MSRLGRTKAAKDKAIREQVAQEMQSMIADTMNRMDCGRSVQTKRAKTRVSSIGFRDLCAGRHTSTKANGDGNAADAVRNAFGRRKPVSQ